jgi:hypothetical protein
LVDNADIIQTVVWDRKTSDKITPFDICKAKNYKTKHNTDYSVIVPETRKKKQKDRLIESS